MPWNKQFCKCFICKGENPVSGGKLVSINTFRRHRKKELDWSISTLNNSEYIDNKLPANSLLEER